MKFAQMKPIHSLVMYVLTVITHALPVTQLPDAPHVPKDMVLAALVYVYRSAAQISIWQTTEFVSAVKTLVQPVKEHQSVVHLVHYL